MILYFVQYTFVIHILYNFRQSLFEEGGKYFDKETGVLEAPMTIRVADQVLKKSSVFYDPTLRGVGHLELSLSIHPSV